jgi:hypothetical protein
MVHLMCAAVAQWRIQRNIHYSFDQIELAYFDSRSNKILIESNAQLLYLLSTERRLTIHALKKPYKIPWSIIALALGVATVSAVTVVCLVGHVAVPVAALGVGTTVAAKGTAVGVAVKGAAVGKAVAGCKAGAVAGKAAVGCKAGAATGQAVAGCKAGAMAGKAAVGCKAGAATGQAVAGCKAGAVAGKAAVAAHGSAQSGMIAAIHAKISALDAVIKCQLAPFQWLVPNGKFVYHSFQVIQSMPRIVRDGSLSDFMTLLYNVVQFTEDAAKL